MESIHEKYRFRDTLPLSARSIDVSCRNFQFKFVSTVTLSFSIQFVDWTGLCLWCLGEKRNYYTIDPVKSTIYNFISHQILFLRSTKKEMFELIFIKKLYTKLKAFPIFVVKIQNKWNIFSFLNHFN